jgi:2,4-dienoyl-CoA reductase-like NADH-dependent reductase (Old Yellow Enzyme family)
MTPTPLHRDSRPPMHGSPAEGPSARSGLFSPLTLRGVTLRHRITIPPMLMYRAGHDGLATPWHQVHYGRLALGGAAMVMLESTAITEQGRVGYADLGLWSDQQVAPLRSIADFIKAEGCVPAIQINHSGRKGGIRRPWDVYIPLNEEDAARGEPPWPVIGPTDVPYTHGAQVPRPMALEDIRQVTLDWASAARRADAAGFEVLEIHAAHGYLLHQFLSPLSNTREDAYGGSLMGRMRLTLEVVAAVRAAWPQEKPLFVRLSCVDGVDGGWSLDDSVVLARKLRTLGVDLIDCSSGGIGGSATNSRVPRGAGFQVPFADRIRREAGIPTQAVGLITHPTLAAEVIGQGRADLVAIGRQALVDPNWPNAATLSLHPEGGYAQWPPETGWWLDKRDLSIATGRA